MNKIRLIGKTSSSFFLSSSIIQIYFLHKKDELKYSINKYNILNIALIDEDIDYMRNILVNSCKNLNYNDSKLEIRCSATPNIIISDDESIKDKKCILIPPFYFPRLWSNIMEAENSYQKLRDYSYTLSFSRDKIEPLMSESILKYGIINQVNTDNQIVIPLVKKCTYVVYFVLNILTYRRGSIFTNNKIIMNMFNIFIIQILLDLSKVIYADYKTIRMFKNMENDVIRFYIAHKSVKESLLFNATYLKSVYEPYIEIRNAMIPIYLYIMSKLN